MQKIQNYMQKIHRNVIAFSFPIVYDNIAKYGMLLKPTLPLKLNERGYMHYGKS